MYASPRIIGAVFVALLALACSACGGSAAELDDGTPAAPSIPTPAPAPTSRAPSAPKPATGKRDDRVSAMTGERVSATSTASRDGRPLYLSMCNTAKESSLEIWGEVTDLDFVVDEAIISFSIMPRHASGMLGCGKNESGVKVVFAEERGAVFEVDPAACTFELFDDGALTGTARGRVAAEYVDARAVRHSFAVAFTAPTCKP